MAAKPPDEDRWRRISALFAMVQPLTRDERKAILDEECPDPEERQLLDELLEQHDSRSGAFASLPDAGSGSAPIREPFELGQQVGRYKIVRRLKPGGMGVLYVGEDVSLKREVVLKVVAPSLAFDLRQQNRLEREAVAMGRLQHPNIATVHEYTRLEGIQVLVTEFVKGCDLRERLREEGRFEEPVPLIDMMLGVARALAAAHAAGVIHRDLKPENIMLPEQGGVKLVDFGIARVEAAATRTVSTLTSEGTLIGTLAYMAPEQLREDKPAVDHRCDLFALGVVFYEAATGLHPFEAHTTVTLVDNILNREPPPLSFAGGQVLRGLDAIVGRCLKKNPDLRYQSATDLIADLERIRRSYDSVVTPPFVDAAPHTAAEKSARLWWYAHQLMVAVWCGLLLIPLWYLRESLIRGTLTNGLWFSGVGLVVVSIMLRFYASFVASHSAEQFFRKRRRIRWTLVCVELAFSAVLAIAAVLLSATKPGVAALLLVGALGTAVALLVIEPGTTEDAFPEVLQAERNARKRSGRPPRTPSGPGA